jgi:hypothetical protein
VSVAHLGARLAGLTLAAEAPLPPPDGEIAALEPGDREEVAKRTPVPAGLLAFWRA